MPAGRPRKPDNRRLPPGVYARTRNGRTRLYDKHGHALGADPRKAALIVAQRAVLEDFTESTWAGASKKYRTRMEARHQAGELSQQTVIAYRKLLDRLDSALGSVRLADIRTLHVNQMMHRVEDRPAWASQLLMMFRQVWQRAIATGLIERADPSHGIKPPAVLARKVVVTPAMFDAVYREADQVVRDWMRLSAVAGQRVGDILALRREHVVGDELRPPNSKTGEPVRIEMSGDLLEVVTELLNRPRRVSGPWLVQNERGQRVTMSALGQRWDKAYKKARALDPSLPAFQRRDLRAMSATSEQTTAQARLGHRSDAMTRRHYIRETDWSAVPLAKPGRLPRKG